MYSPNQFARKFNKLYVDRSKYLMEWPLTDAALKQLQQDIDRRYFLMNPPENDNRYEEEEENNDWPVYSVEVQSTLPLVLPNVSPMLDRQGGGSSPDHREASRSRSRGVDDRRGEACGWAPASSLLHQGEEEETCNKPAILRSGSTDGNQTSSFASARQLSASEKSCQGKRKPTVVYAVYYNYEVDYFIEGKTFWDNLSSWESLRKRQKRERKDFWSELSRATPTDDLEDEMFNHPPDTIR